jgi:hypothetical protein
MIRYAAKTVAAVLVVMLCLIAGTFRDVGRVARSMPLTLLPSGGGPHRKKFLFRET